MAEYIERVSAFEYNEQCKKCFHFQVCASVLKQQLFVREKMLAEENPKCSYYIPAADVVEVRHGCWRVIENRLHFDVKCSVCNSSFYVYKQGQYRIDQSNYCPNCGAKMDGVTDANVGGKMDGKGEE